MQLSNLSLLIASFDRDKLISRSSGRCLSYSVQKVWLLTENHIEQRLTTEPTRQGTADLLLRMNRHLVGLVRLSSLCKQLCLAGRLHSDVPPGSLLNDWPTVGVRVF